jgi:hypothetical protein
MTPARPTRQTPSRGRIGTPSVAVVVPWPDRQTLLPDEETSVRHLRHYLGRYDKFAIVPRSLELSLPDIEIVRFDDRYFGSTRRHTELMLSPRFYEAFRGYEFILTYHLDALVLSDRLSEWCEREWDFIGAPNHGTAKHLSVPCNGGFALRRIEAFLAVLKSKRYAVDPETYWADFCAGKGRFERMLQWPRRYAKRLHRFNGVHREIRLMLDDPAPPLDDVFMVENATKYHPGFRIPPVREALRFAFDEAPRTAFELNDCQLPFGAHAWFKHDRAFWAPYLLR